MINVATGVLALTLRDYFIPGRINLVWGRYYSTALLTKNRLPTPFGPGWSMPYLARLDIKKHQYRFIDGQGQVIIFNDPEQQIERKQSLRNLSQFCSLHFSAPYFIITRWPFKEKGHVLRYKFLLTEKSTQLVSLEDLSGQGLDLIYANKTA